MLTRNREDGTMLGVSDISRKNDLITIKYKKAIS